MDRIVALGTLLDGHYPHLIMSPKKVTSWPFCHVVLPLLLPIAWLCQSNIEVPNLPCEILGQQWNHFTMLQKLSKCEVKSWLCRNLIILPPLRFYVKSNFGKFKRSKNVIFGNSRPSELWNLVNLGLESCSNLLKSKFRTYKIGRNDIFGLFEFAKIGFHVKSELK